VTKFHLGDVLSVTTERLVSPNGVGGVYRILNHLTGDDLFTHQLPRAVDACKPAVLAQHPQLADVEVPGDFGGEAGVRSWLAEQVAVYGERLEVTPVAGWEPRDPIAELVERVGADRVVPVLVDGPAPAKETS
jgi:hypothetical protein